MVRRSARLISLYILEGIAAFLALVIFAGGVILWRLSAGPVSLEFIKPSATQALAEALGGDRADVANLTVSYDPDYAALVISGSGVRIFDENDQIIAASQFIEAGLALDLLLIGKAVPVRISANGGSFSFSRLNSGQIEGQFLPVQINSEERSRALNETISAFNDSRSGGLLSRLIAVDLKDIDLRYADEALGLLLLIEDAASHIDLNDESLSAQTQGVILTQTGQTPVSFELVSNADLSAFFLDLRIRDLVLSSILGDPISPNLLTGLTTPLDLDLVIDTSRETGLRSMLIDLMIGGGAFTGPNGRVNVEDGRAQLSYDTQAGVIDIQSISLNSDQYRLDLSGQLSDLSGFEDAWPTQADFQLNSGEGLVSTGGIFPRPIQWQSIQSQGHINLADLQLSFDELSAEIEGASGSFAGSLGAEQIDGNWYPTIKVSGPIEGVVNKDRVLDFWPVNFALGARDWIDERLLGGQLYDARLGLDIPASAIHARQLENEHLSLSFRFSDASVQYVSTMTPIYGLSGEGHLFGNSFTLSGNDGTIGDLQADTIFVNIPRLNPKGAVARFGGTGRGDAGDLVGLINQEPLSLADIYGFNSDDFSGEGTISFEIGRPMLRNVPAEDMLFDVTARFESVTGQSGISDLGFSDANVLVQASQERMTAHGEGVILGQQAIIDWEEVFGLEEGADRTTIYFTMNANARLLDEFGIPVRRFMDGPIGVNAYLNGNGFEFSRADFSLGLTDTAIALPDDLWVKPPGQPATANLQLEGDGDGLVHIRQLGLQAESANITGQAVLTEAGQLVSAQLDHAAIDELIDLSVGIETPLSDPNLDRLTINMHGAYLNAEQLIDQWRNSASQSDEEDALEPDDPSRALPMNLSARLNRLDLKGVSYDGVLLNYTSSSFGIENMTMEAVSQAGPLSLHINQGETPQSNRITHAYAADAGSALQGFLGFENAVGGELEFSGEISPLGEGSNLIGELKVSDFTIEGMPLLARLLAAGSLEGIGSLLSGEGIEFQTLESDIQWQDGVFSMRNARVAGPALGLTWSGVVDLNDDRVGIDGTLVPSYGTNSFLGELPVLGGLLTSREGEGIIGITFGVDGPFGATRVTANPLSALAPGVFRRIFEGTDVVDSQPETPDEPDTDSQ